MWIQTRFGVNRTVIALSIARLADAMGNSMIFIVIPLYVAQLPAPSFPLPESVLVGMLISLYGLIFSMAQPVMGVISDHLRRRKVFILGGLVVMTGSTLAFTLASRYVDLLLIRSLQGVGVALMVPAALAVLSKSTEKHTRGGSMGFYSMMRMVGFSLGPLIGGLVHVKFGFNAVFFTAAFILLISMTLVQQWVDDPPEEGPFHEVERPRLFNPALLANGTGFLGVATFLMATSFSLMTALENEFNARLEQTALGFGIAFSALTITRLIFQLPLGRLSDRIGRKPLIIGGLIFMAPATVLLGYVSSTLQLTGARALQGLAAAGIAAPTFALAADLSRVGTEGQQMSVIAMGFGFGITVGPLVAGLLAVRAFELPFLIGGLLCLGGAWLVHRKVPESIGPGAARALGEDR
jgi:MFS family permease